MPSPGPQSRFETFESIGVLNEWMTPQRVGGKGLTACNNLVYHRDGTWGKRPGAKQIALPIGGVGPYVSGVRWYSTFPNIITKLVVWEEGNLLIGDNPGALAPIPGPISRTANIAPDFCSMRDPQANSGNGRDVLIVAGLTLGNGSFGTGSIVIVNNPSSTVNAQVSVTFNNGGVIVSTQTYQILPTDNPASIAQQIVELINGSSAYVNNNSGNPPFLGVSYFIVPSNTDAGVPAPQAIVHLGAAIGGSSSNGITFSVTFSGSDSGGVVMNLNGNTPITFNTPPYPTRNFTGGGNSWSGPLRYDVGLGTLVGLSYMCPNPFTGCTTWHDHAWFWGDPGNPDTVFASDINQPEAFTFMVENGGMNGPLNGGYNIGPGDGDPSIQNCVPNGNSLYIFKTANIYQMTGYDFQQGEYQFSVTPQVVGYGIPFRDCVDVLEGQYVFWSGKKALRLAVGAYEPEHIGMPIALQEGLAAGGDQTLVRVVAGDFQVQTVLTNSYATGFGASPPQQPILLRSLALFAVDAGDGKPDTILVYDDDKTASSQSYAWSVWTGWNVGCWIKYGAGVNPAGKQDKPLLFFVQPGGHFIYQVGANPTDDWGNPIPWMAQTGWIDFGTPELIKNIHEFYLRVEATAGATFIVNVIPARIVPPIGQQSQFPPGPVSFNFAPTLAPNQCEALNDLKSFIQAALQTEAAIIQFTESGATLAAFELLGYGVDVNPQEAYQT